MGGMTMTYSRQVAADIKATWMDYTLVLLIVALTGFQFCFNFAGGIFFLVGPLAAYMFVKRHRYFTPSVWIFLVVLLIWMLGQNISGLSATSALGNFFLRFLIYLLAAFAVNQFEKVFVKIIVFFALISIPFWLLSNYVPGGYNILTSLPEVKFGTLGLNTEYNSNPGYSIGFYYVAKSIRNSGPFWEPGMFAVFLNIALAIKLMSTRKPFDRDSIIILVALFSTFSTTGYIAAMTILAWYFIFIDFRPKSLALIAFLGLAFIAFLNSDFGRSKIEDTISNKDEHSRFAAIAYHFMLLKDHYFTGCGFQSGNTSKLLTSPNGLSFVFYFWGIPFGIYYFYRLYQAAKKIITRISLSKAGLSTIILFLTLLIVAFSQDVTTRHFYYFLIAYSFIPATKTSLK